MAITVREAVTRAIDDLGGKATPKQLTARVHALRPGTKTNTLGAHLVSMCVNNPSRVHFPSARNARSFPFRRSPELEILFRSGGIFERYDPRRHGIWEIVKGTDDKLLNRLSSEAAVTPSGADIEPDLETEVDVTIVGGSTFAAESHLRDYLARNLDQIEQGLDLYRDPDGAVGIESATDVGIIDLLATDRDGGFVVIELKVGKSPDSVVGQALRYRSWVSRHLANGAPARAVIVAEAISDKIRYATDGLGGFGLLEYEIHFSVRPARPLPPS